VDLKQNTRGAIVCESRNFVIVEVLLAKFWHTDLPIVTQLKCEINIWHGVVLGLLKVKRVSRAQVAGFLFRGSSAACKRCGKQY
jgi:hypothetical protein